VYPITQAPPAVFCKHGDTTTVIIHAGITTSFHTCSRFAYHHGVYGINAGSGQANGTLIYVTGQIGNEPKVTLKRVWITSFGIHRMSGVVQNDTLLTISAGRYLLLDAANAIAMGY